MTSFYTLLRKGYLGVILLFVQACTQDIPTPSATIGTKTVDSITQENGQGVLLQRVRRAVAGTSSTGGSYGKNGVYTQRLVQCFDIYDVYYDLSTGQELKRVFITRDCSGNDTGDGGGGGGGDTGGGGGGGPTGPGSGGAGASQSVVSQLPPCSTNVLNNLLLSATQSGAANNLLDAILTALQMPNSAMSITFKTDNTLAANVAGDCGFERLITNNTGINHFTIRLNPTYLGGGTQATDLFVAQIMLHEMLHAALMDWALTNGSTVNGVSFDDVLAHYMAMQGLSPGDGQGQHDAMSLLVGELGGGLYNYYTSIDHAGSLGSQNNQFTNAQDCTNLCWTGLENSIGYKWAASRDPLFKFRCDAIHGAELTGRYAATGSKADGTDQERFPAGAASCP